MNGPTTIPTHEVRKLVMRLRCQADDHFQRSKEWRNADPESYGPELRSRQEALSDGIAQGIELAAQSIGYTLDQNARKHTPASEITPDIPDDPPWNWIELEPRKALRMVGISFREQDESGDLRVHVVAEDPRYPMMCVNGNLNFGVKVDPTTGTPEGPRLCICNTRHTETCICDTTP